MWKVYWQTDGQTDDKHVINTQIKALHSLGLIKDIFRKIKNKTVIKFKDNITACTLYGILKRLMHIDCWFVKISIPMKFSSEKVYFTL